MTNLLPFSVEFGLLFGLVTEPSKPPCLPTIIHLYSILEGNFVYIYALLIGRCGLGAAATIRPLTSSFKAEDG